MNFTIIQKHVLLKCRGNINFDVCRKFGSVLLLSPARTVFRHKQFVQPCTLVPNNLLHTISIQFKNDGQNLVSKINGTHSGLQIKKKRPVRKSKNLLDNGEKLDVWNVQALATAEEYNLESLMVGLTQQKLYLPDTISISPSSLPDVVHAVAKYEVENEPREIFFFREGTVVLWNISELECGNVLQFLKKYEENCYADAIVQSESEVMNYTYSDTGKSSHLKDGNIVLAAHGTNLDKYAFSNAIAQSVKLGIWEASLNHYIDSIEFVTEDLKNGRKLNMTQQEVLRKQGELFALRHLINLSSDLLDTPDFYWERDDLELLYQQTCSYFSISKRTRVINEKLNHCVELVAIVSSHLSDRHHIRLEWMIIILIMVEVAFETLHYVERYFS